MSTTLDTTHDSTHVDELRLLEAEAVHIIREVVAELTKPVLLFSAGKDSIVLLRLAEKAFRPAPLPFPVLHVDTGHNFDEVIAFRDRRVSEQGHTLIVGSVQETIDAGRVADPGPGASRNRQQTRTLLDALEAGGFDAAFGGARRDEERARAKERILSFRDEFGQWDPRAQRPEPWSLYNGRIRKGEQVRVFPLSNWTELDIWRYIELEGLEGETFDLVQYQVLAGTLRALATRYPLTEVVGHEHVSPGRKRDPGPGFDWSLLRRLLRRRSPRLWPHIGEGP